MTMNSPRSLGLLVGIQWNMHLQVTLYTGCGATVNHVLHHQDNIEFAHIILLVLFSNVDS